MARRTPLFLALLLAALVAGVALFVVGTGDQGERGEPALAAAPSSRPRNAESSEAGLAAPAEDVDETGAAPESEAPASGASPEQREVAEDQPRARWVEGRVVLPAGTPPSEQVRIEYKGGGVHKTMDAEPDGTFAVPFPERTLVGRLGVLGRHVYLESTWHRVQFDEHEGPVTLELSLGGRIVGVVSTSLLSAADVDALPGTEAHLRGRDPRDGTFDTHTAIVDENLSFEFDGLRPGDEYALTYSPGVAVDAALEDLIVNAGQTSDVVLELRPGVRVAGTVSSVTGEPLSRVHLEVWSSQGDWRWASSSSDVPVADDGTFDASGIEPGTVVLVGRAEGLATEVLELGERASGERLDGVGMVLTEGNYFEGTCVWPDGSPAEGVRVTVSERDDDDRFVVTLGGVAQEEDQELPFLDGRRVTVRTPADGSFRVTGLTRGPFSLKAEGRLPLGPDATIADRRRNRREGKRSLLLEDVAPNSSGLVLVIGGGVSLRGRVLDDAERPVDEFVVTARPHEANQWSGSSVGVTRRLSEAGGYFEIAGFHEGKWRVRVRAADHVDGDERVISLPSDDHEFVLARQASIRGVVRDPKGRPAKGAMVGVATLEDGSERWRVDKSADSDGEFSVDNVTPGIVRVTARGGGFAASATTELTIGPGDVVRGVDLVLQVGGAITGEVRSVGGARVGFREVKLQSSTNRDLDEEQTDESGRFRFDDVAPGSYLLVATPPDEPDFGNEDFDWQSWQEGHLYAQAEVIGSETIHVVLGAQPDSAIEVTGIVRRSGEPVEGVHVWAAGTTRATVRFPSSATTDANGRYTLSLTAPGRYSFAVGAAGKSYAVDVPDVRRHEVDFEVFGGRLAGRVVGHDGAVPEHIRLTLTPITAASDADSVATGVADTGEFEFADLEAGTYDLTAAEWFWGAAPTYGITRIEGISVGADEGANDVLVVLAESATLSGTVRDAHGRRAGRASLLVRSASGGVVHGQHLSSLETDSSGYFEVPWLSEGTWSVEAHLGNAAGWSAPVTLRPGETASVQIELGRATKLLVRVLRGGARVQASVTVLDSSGRGYPASAPLVPGTYLVTATDQKGSSVTEEVTLKGESEREVVLKLE